MNTHRLVGLFCLALAAAVTAAPLGNGLTYQGQVKKDGLPLSDTADFRFTLWDAASAGTADPDVSTKPAVSVVNGLFTVTLDFGPGAFEGSARFLAIEVRHPAGSGSFVPMGARQAITAAPYALYALSAPGGGSGGTLDQAYDFGGAGAGRTITADSGPVAINGPDGMTVSGGIDAGPVEIDIDGNQIDLQVDRGPILGAGDRSNVTIGGLFKTGTVGSPVDHFAYLRVTGTDHRIFRDPTSDLRFSTQTVVNNDNAQIVPVDQLTLKDTGRVGIGTTVPVAMLHVDDNTDLSSSSGGVLVLGSTSSANMVFDGNEIMTRNAGNPAPLTINLEGGNVGIGTNPSSAARLHVNVPGTDGDTALYAVTYGSGRAATFESHQDNTNPTVRVFKNGGPALQLSGSLSATDAATDAPLAVIGGSDSGLAGGGFAVFGSTTGQNISVDNNEIMARDAGGASTLFLNHGGGTVAISAANAGYGLGIGTTAPKQRLHVVGDYYGRGHLYLYAYEGDGSSGTAYVQARDDTNTTNIDLRLRSKAGATAVDVLTCKSNGRVGIGTTAPASLLDVAGTARVNVLVIDGGADLSENFDVLAAPSEPRQNGADLDFPSRDREGAGSEVGNEATRQQGTDITPGMVVAIDPENPGKLRVATSAYDSTVAGVISGAGGVSTGMVMAHEGTLADGSHPVALTGRVYCKVDASYGAIRPGDLLTTSDTPGHAMKVTDRERAGGAILGKAMTSLTEGEKGLVLVLVSLQ